MTDNAPQPPEAVIKEVALRLGVSRETAAAWLAAGCLMFTEGESQTYFRLREILKRQRLMHSPCRS